jgi:antitoxin (DNA-binding transcriptional repressor) of toxin-antitoxin stability system
MKTITMMKAAGSLADYARDLRGPLIITNHGRPVAALVPIEELDLETLAVGTSPKFLDIIEKSRRRQEIEGGISNDEITNRYGREAKGKRKPNGINRKASRVARVRRNAS